MVNELFMYDHMITLIEAAKKATKKLKRKKIERKIKRILEKKQNYVTKQDVEDLLKQYATKQEVEKLQSSMGTMSNQIVGISHYIGINNILKGWLIGIKNIAGEYGYDAVKDMLIDSTGAVKYLMKPENLYLLKPTIEAMRIYLSKCKEITDGSGKASNNLLENDKNKIIVTEEDCKFIVPLFQDFVKKYESMEKNTSFYKKWYYWYLSLPNWKKILITLALLVVLLVILLLVFKAGSKVVKAIKKALKGDKIVGKQLVAAASKADSNTKTTAFKVAFEPLANRAALYL